VTDMGMGRRPLLAMVLGWLTVVVAVGAITFLVVDRAGRGVGRASAAERVVVLPSASPTPSASRPTAKPADAGKGTASFTSDGGTVVASCDGSAMALDSIRPRDGWRFEKETEHGGLEVVFRTDARRVDLLLSCVGGVPTRAAHE